MHPTVVVVITTVLALFRLGQKSLWFDEAFSHAMADLDLAGLWRAIVHQESFNALYYNLLHVWIRGGESEVWLRLPSVIFAVVAAYMLFLVNRRLLGSGAATIAGILLATNVLFINYAQEARAYSLALLGVVASTYLFIRAVEQPSTGRWFAYALASVMAIYALAFAAFVIMAHVIVLLVRRRIPRLRHFAAGYGVLAVLSVPLMLLLLGTDPLQRPFTRSPTGETLRWVFLNFVGADNFATGVQLGPRRSIALLALYLIAALAAVVLTLRGRRDEPPGSLHRERAWYILLLVLWFIVPIASTFLISLARPIVHPQYLLVSLPALVTLAAVGIDRVSIRPVQVVFLSALVWLAFPSLVAYFRTDCKRPTENWRAAVEYVQERHERGDGVLLLSHYGRVPFEYYLSLSDAAELQPVYPSAPWGEYPLVSDTPESPWVASVRLSQERDRVWTMLTWGGFSTAGEEGQVLASVLDHQYELLEEKSLCRYMRVRLYSRSR